MVMRESQKDKPLYSEGISCTSCTTYQCLFLSSCTFTSNNSPAPFGTVLELPVAHFLSEKTTDVKSKHPVLMPLLQLKSEAPQATKNNSSKEKANNSRAKQTRGFYLDVDQ